MRVVVFEDEVTVGRDFDARGLTVFVRSAQGDQLARMDANDLGTLRKARREQGGGVLPRYPKARTVRARNPRNAPPTRFHSAALLVLSTGSSIRRTPSSTRCRWTVAYRSRGCRRHMRGESRAPGGLGLLTGRLVGDDVAEEDAVVARDERGRVGAG